jgi:intein/homing endonuclease
MNISKLTTILVLILVCVSIPLYAEAEEERKLDQFDRVEVSGSFDLVFTQGDEGFAVIEQSSVNRELIITEVEDNTLKISLKKGTRYSKGPAARITITYKELKSIYNSGSSSIICESEITGQSFEFRNSGSGMAKIPMLKVAALSVEISGSGGVNVGGTADEQEIKINGSGSINGFELISEVSKINIAGSGDAQVHVKERLDAKLIGSGSVRYKGTVKAPSVSVLGSGSVKRAS